MQTITLDFRGESPADTSMRLIEAYNRAAPGTDLNLISDNLEVHLQIRMVEGGMRYHAERTAEGDWQVKLRRGNVPAQGTIPGLHHLKMGPSGTLYTCERGARIAAYDTVAGQFIWQRPLAEKASHLAVSPSEDRLYVADPGADAMLVIDPKDGRLLQTLSVPGQPQLPLVVTDGIICVTGGITGTLSLFRKSDDGVFHCQLIEVGTAPHDPIASLDGQFLFVPCLGDGDIVKVCVENGEIVGRFPCGDGPGHLDMHPDGSHLYIGNTFDGTVSCLSIDGEMLGQVESGGWSHVAQVTPDGKWVYAANFYDNTLCVFHADSLEKVRQLDTDIYPHGLYIAPNGKIVMATGFGSAYLRVYSTETHEEIARIKVGYGSSHVCFSADSEQAWVTCSVDDHLAHIDLEQLKNVGRIQLDNP